jgi:hypothetical protein
MRLLSSIGVHLAAARGGTCSCCTRARGPLETGIGPCGKVGRIGAPNLKGAFGLFEAPARASDHDAKKHLPLSQRPNRSGLPLSLAPTAQYLDRIIVHGIN